VSIDSKVVLQILKRSPQGFTPFEILEELLTQPPYQGFSRASLYSKLLPKLQNLRDSQVVAHVSPRWMLVEFLENKPGEVNSQFEGRVNSQKSDETEGLNFPNQSEQATTSHLQESTPNVNDRDLVKNREATLFSFDDVKQETNRDFKFSDRTPIEVLNLSTLCHRNLKRAGIDTIEKIQAYSDKDLLSIRNFGSKSLDELKKALGKWESLSQDVKQENKPNLKYSLSSPLQILNLSSHTYNTLKRAGIDTIEELKAYSNEDLLTIKNFGQKLLSEVRNALANFKHLPTSAPLQYLGLLPDWAKHPVFQLSTSHLSLPTELNNILNRFPTVAQLLCDLEADNIALSSEEKAQIQRATALFKELRDAPQSYLDWLASLSQTTRIKVLTKYKWTPARLEELELSPQEIMSVISSVEREKTRYAIILGTIPSKPFVTVAEEIDDWLYPLNDTYKFVLKQRLGWQSGNQKTMEDIGQEMGLSRERVRQIEVNAKRRLNTIRYELILPKLRKVAIETLHSAGCVNTLEDWCEDIAQIYPPGEVHLPSVLSWLIDLVLQYLVCQINSRFKKKEKIM
jgi:hypothetical protein